MASRASLPGKDGGLLVRQVVLLAFPAFLVSAMSTLPFQDTITTTWPYNRDTVARYRRTRNAMVIFCFLLPTNSQPWKIPSILAVRGLMAESLDRSATEGLFCGCEFSPQVRLVFGSAQSPGATRHSV